VVERRSPRAAFDRLAEILRVSPAEVALALLLALVVVAGSFVVFRRSREPPPPPLRIERVESRTPAGERLLVHVTGKVVTPGLYPLPPGSRVNDAIAAAGGPAPGADGDALNLAAPVADGEQVLVPAVGEAPPAAQSGKGAGPAPRTNLNTATQAELEQLPGIGPKLAQRVLAYRQRKGRFTKLQDLLEVEGFGPKKLAALEDQVMVR
jgi:competence protein ComEA